MITDRITGEVAPAHCQQRERERLDRHTPDIICPESRNTYKESVGSSTDSKQNIYSLNMLLTNSNAIKSSSSQTKNHS